MDSLCCPKCGGPSHLRPLGFKGYTMNFHVCHECQIAFHTLILPFTTPPPGNSLELLTRREREVWQLACSGCSNKDIADRLRISRRTVEVYRSNISKKWHHVSHPLAGGNDSPRLELNS
ncbi:MAG: response regulator transcription factor [Chloroflexi bacterium]|nr:response regulator transcription factor [Chloroflexota bacterium]